VFLGLVLLAAQVAASTRTGESYEVTLEALSTGGATDFGASHEIGSSVGQAPGGS